MKKPFVSFDEDNNIYLDWTNKQYRLCLEINNNGKSEWEFYDRINKISETNETSDKKFIECLLKFKDE